MSPAERRERHRYDLNYVHLSTAMSWANTNMAELRVVNVRRRMSRISVEPDIKTPGLRIKIPPRVDFDKVVARYWRASRRLLFLDYDGTLVPIVKSPKDAVPPPRVIDLLEKLAAVRPS